VKPKFVPGGNRCNVIEWIDGSSIDRSGRPNDQEWLSTGLSISDDRAVEFVNLHAPEIID
jgi:hypothetical protein